MSDSFQIFGDFEVLSVKPSIEKNVKLMTSAPFRMTIKLNKLVSKQKEIIKRRAKNK